jgi:glucuronate isomerase
MDFIHGDFLLSTEAARRLYHGYAAGEPILDYHSHLPAGEIAANRRFKNLFEIWLEGDHYKWRAMRANGVDEAYCTGAAPAYEKFLAWARTVPFVLRNPLYHWTHLELKRHFGISELLDEGTAPSVWDRANQSLQCGDLAAGEILRKFHVQVVCTTDDPCDDLTAHRKIAASERSFRVLPTFRPDKALRVDDAGGFNQWVDRLEAASDVAITSMQDFQDALKRRHDFFHEHGARLSDHGLDCCFARPGTPQQVEAIFAKAREGRSVATPDEAALFGAHLLVFFSRLDTEKGWTKQLHIGARRNLNTRRMHELGPDQGFDGIGDGNQAGNLAAFLDLLDRQASLPKLIVYNANPADNYAFATVIGGFQEGPLAGKLQFGSGWWFLDQKEGIELQLNALSNTGLLARFVGMLTDSRSFMSFPRHEYFRRVLCNMLGREMENGELPNDEKLVGNVVKNICHRNAQAYFEFGGNSADEIAEAPRTVTSGSSPTV